MIAERIVRGMFDLVLPPCCICCGQPRSDENAQHCLCVSCCDQMAALVAAPACPRCGRSVGPHASCPACGKRKPPFGAAVRIGIYDGPLAHLVRMAKYRGQPYATSQLARLMLSRLWLVPEAEQVDLVTAVPLHWWRFYRRGFNQSVLLARELRRQGLAAPLKRVLVRTRNTRPQVGLSRAARLDNVRGAFRVRQSEQVRGRRILLLDDVMTTGATLEACARELLKHGASRVTVAVAAVREGGQQTIAL